ncbi:MAG: glycolate oxidase subunit GlcE, partial [Pseudomonadales bacterium]
LGGAVAAGLAGPARSWRGAVRDSVLGVELANGRGERLRFGGQVMKNVAGYDVSRLQVGAFGTLGLLLSISVRLLPRPEAEQTRVFELTASEALGRCRDWARQPLPLSGTCHHAGRLFVRLSGASAAVTAAAARLGGEAHADEGFWPALRDHRHPFFEATGEVLWRAVVPPAAPVTNAAALIGWGGAERWHWRPPGDTSAAAEAAAAGGHARPFDGGFGYRDGPHLPEPERRLGARLRDAFDPERILNRNLGEAPEQDHAD